MKLPIAITRFRSALIVFGLVIGASPGLAQTSSPYPSRPITVVIPFAAGGPTDLVARAVTSRMSQLLGQPLVADNRSGGGGAVGTAHAARSSPDGYTLIVGNPGSHATAPLLDRGITYDPIEDFTFVALLGTSSFVLLCNSKLPIQNVREFIEHARRNPGAMTYGSAGIGSNVHFIFEYLKLRANIDLLHVPYKGAAPMITDLLAGVIDCTFDSASKQHIEAGRLRALAVSSNVRDPIYPTVPTLEEGGVADFNISSWQALMAPKKTSPEIVKKLNLAANEALRQPETATQFLKFGFHVAGGTPEDLRSLAIRDRDLYRTIYSSANIKLQ